VQPIRGNDQLVVHVCSNCHVRIFAQYKESVHGQALLVDNDTNAPDCVDCHGVHGINHPTTALARNRSPELCAKCHADEELMKQYGISTNVFDSYLADFHGTTLSLFSQQDPDVASNKAVCYDCHGVHNITPADDTKSQVAKQNLLATCQQCHPNATADFPDAWVGHFQPTAEDHPLLFVVKWFYKILIPAVLGGFGVLVASDVFYRGRRFVFGKPSPTHDTTSQEGADDGDAS
jgi:predicted CXXCH cytochrome family protein